MKSRRSLDWNYGISLASLFVTIPYAMAALAHVKGVEVGNGWFYTLLPGFGMAICGTIGNSMVVSAAGMMPGLSRKARVGLWAISVVTVLATVFVLSCHMMAQYRDLTLVELLGPWLFGLWTVSAFTMAELQAPGNFTISMFKRQAAAAAAETRSTIAQGAATPALIQAALEEEDGQTAAMLAEVCDVGVPAMNNNLKKMRDHGQLVAEHTGEHGRSLVWSLAGVA